MSMMKLDHHQSSDQISKIVKITITPTAAAVVGDKMLFKLALTKT